MRKHSTRNPINRKAATARRCTTTRRLRFEKLDRRDLLAADVNLLSSEPEPFVRYHLDIVDLAGEPISTASVGEQFVAQVYVSDLRPDPQGVFAGFVGIGFDEKAVDLEPGITVSDEFRNFDFAERVLMGGVSTTLEPNLERTSLLASIPMVAKAEGAISIFPTPAPNNIAFDTLLFGENDPIPVPAIQFTGDTLSIRHNDPIPTPVSQPSNPSTPSNSSSDLAAAAALGQLGSLSASFRAGPTLASTLNHTNLLNEHPHFVLDASSTISRNVGTRLGTKVRWQFGDDQRSIDDQLISPAIQRRYLRREISDDVIPLDVAEWIELETASGRVLLSKIGNRPRTAARSLFFDGRSTSRPSIFDQLATLDLSVKSTHHESTRLGHRQSEMLLIGRDENRGAASERHQSAANSLVDISSTIRDKGNLHAPPTNVPRLSPKNVDTLFSMGIRGRSQPHNLSRFELVKETNRSARTPILKEDQVERSASDRKNQNQGSAKPTGTDPT